MFQFHINTFPFEDSVAEVCTIDVKEDGKPGILHGMVLISISDTNI